MSKHNELSRSHRTFGEWLRLLSFLLLALVFLPGAKCSHAPSHAPVHTPNPAAAMVEPASGPSAAIVPVPGSGFTNWAGVYPYGTYGTKIITDDINGYRAQHGLSHLAWHDGLAPVAHMHAQEMATTNSLFFVDSAGINDYERLVSSAPAISFSNCQVLVHSGAVGNPGVVLSDFLASPAAAAVLNNPSWTQIGVGWASVNGNIYESVILGQNVLP